MNLLFIAQCSKNALTETRRILDQFAERCGERTWQTAMTAQGLDMVYRLLRRSARKNTAVACHWIRSKNHSELLWLVGDMRQFNAEGRVPTNITRRNVLRQQDENDWHNLEDIRLLSGLAALFHDMGKANDAFQQKLAPNHAQQAIADAFRHEWVSLRVLQAFVAVTSSETLPPAARDKAWLNALAELPSLSTKQQHALVKNLLAHLKKDGLATEVLGSPFSTLPPFAQAVGWLVVSHHRMPSLQGGSKDDKQAFQKSLGMLPRLPLGIEAAWCGANPKAELAAMRQCWTFSQGLPLSSRAWQKRAKRLALRCLSRAALLPEHEESTVLNSPYILHLARLSLMLADHYYSSLPRNPRYGDTSPAESADADVGALFANTRFLNTQEKRVQGMAETATVRVLNQHLDEHLIGVEVNAGMLVHSLPSLSQSLPRLARHRELRKPTTAAQYRWQNKAADLAESVREASEHGGFFGINMASTGCGKTLANARIMYALANPQQGARFSIALGLRTLTLQTGEAYRQRLHLSEADLAVLVGGGGIAALYAQEQEQTAPSTANIPPQLNPANNGNESSADLLPEHSHVRYEGSLVEGPLKRWLDNRSERGGQAHALLDAPILVSTIDHLMPATESLRGGQQILPMLRLLTSDLVLDEPDDFDINDLYALSRLVYFAGLLGSRVLLSSATLPPAIVHGLLTAYVEGRKAWQAHRGTPNTPLLMPCAWFDEFGCRTELLPIHGENQPTSSASPASFTPLTPFTTAHAAFVQERLRQLSKVAIKRRATLLPFPASDNLPARRQDKERAICRTLAGILLQQAQALHGDHHTVDASTGCRVSFGLIRMANIRPLVEVALALFAASTPPKVQIHLCVYHSQHPALARARLEKNLDQILKRGNEQAVFGLNEIKTKLTAQPQQDHLFLVLATSVAEVGRDHDYDWAIVEPSSMRSIIQLAGRIKRHRNAPCPVDTPNIALLETNIKSRRDGAGTPTFHHPGFEAGSREGNARFLLISHTLSKILEPRQWQTPDSAARIQASLPEILPSKNLVALEHARLAEVMLGEHPDGEMLQESVERWWQDHSRAQLSGLLQRKHPFRLDTRGRERYAFLPNEDGNDVGFYRLPDKFGLPPTPCSKLLTWMDDSEVFTGNVKAWSMYPYLDSLQALAEAENMDISRCAYQYGTLDLPTPADGADPWRYHWALGMSG